MKGKLIFKSTALITAFYCSISLGQTTPIKGKLDSRIRHANYSENQVFHINAGIGKVTHLKFSEGEVFEKWYAGDSESIEFSTHKNYVQFKPVVTKIDTNLLILTNKRAYNIDLHLGGPVYWGVHFRYPDEERRVKEQKKILDETKELLNPDIQIEKNKQYVGAGSDDIRPDRVYDNGTHTYFHFPEQVDIPAIFRVRKGNREIITQAITYGNWRIVPRIQSHWALRLGKEVLSIKNLGFTTNATENFTNSISSKIQRTPKNVSSREVQK